MQFFEHARSRGRQGNALGAMLALFVFGLAVHADDPKEPDASLHEGEPAASFDNLTGDWWGARRKLAEKGITFDIDYMSDFTKNFRGGVDPEGSTWRRMFEATMTLVKVVNVTNNVGATATLWNSIRQNDAGFRWAARSVFRNEVVHLVRHAHCGGLVQ